MQWDDSRNGGFTLNEVPFTQMVEGDLDYRHVNVASQLNDPDSLFHIIQKMIDLRKKHAAFGGSDMQWLETGNPAIAAYLREHEGDAMLVFNNLSGSVQGIDVPPDYQSVCLNVLTGQTCDLGAKLELQPYSYLWMQVQR